MIMRVNLRIDGALSQPPAPYDPFRSAGAVLRWQTTGPEREGPPARPAEVSEEPMLVDGHLYLDVMERTVVDDEPSIRRSVWRLLLENQGS